MKKLGSEVPEITSNEFDEWFGEDRIAESEHSKNYWSSFVQYNTVIVDMEKCFLMLERTLCFKDAATGQLMMTN